MFWKANVTDFSLVSFLKNHIGGDVKGVDGKMWRFIGVCVGGRKHLKIKRLGS